MQTQTNPLVSPKLSAIDRALAAAKARRAANAAANGETLETTSTPKAEKAPKQPKAPKADSTERDAAKVQRAAERAERKAAKVAREAADRAAKDARRAERDAKKEARRAQKEADKANKKPAHMKKVDRARAKCPTLSSEAAQTFNDIATNFSASQVEALAQHLLVQARAMLTLNSLSSPQLPLGSTVSITGGELRYVGMTGKVVHSQKLRAKVLVEGVKKPVYIYTCQANVVNA